MIQIRRVSAEDSKVKLLLYGRPGVGKTTLAATANDHPRLAPVLFLSFEGGLLSVVSRGDIDEVEIKTMADLEDSYLRIKNKEGEFAKYATVVIDSASELYTRSLQEAVEGRKRNPDPYEVELGDYGRAGYQSITLFRAFRDLPINVIMTAHPRFTYPPAQRGAAQFAEPTEVTPNFPAKVSTSLMGIADAVWYQYTWNETNEEGGTLTRRGLLTQDRGVYRAKTRGPNFAKALGPVVEDPNLPDLYDLLIATESTSNGKDGAYTQAMTEQFSVEQTKVAPSGTISFSNFVSVDDKEGD